MMGPPAHEPESHNVTGAKMTNKHTEHYKKVGESRENERGEHANEGKRHLGERRPSLRLRVTALTEEPNIDVG